MTTVAILTASLLVLPAIGLAAAPKPWQWTPRQATSYLNQTKPEIHPGIDGYRTSMTGVSGCRGLGTKVAGRFVSFRCTASFRAISGQSERRPLWAKVRKVGRGQLCVSLIGKVPLPCLAPTGPTRTLGEADDAETAMREHLQVKYAIVSFAAISCLGHGAGYYVCVFQAERDGRIAVTLTTRGPRFSAVTFSS